MPPSFKQSPTVLLLMAVVLTASACSEPLRISGGGGGEDGEPDPWTSPPGLLVVPNLDDDNDNGTPDWEDEGVAEDNERSEFTIEPTAFSGVGSGGGVRLSINGAASSFRVYLNGEVVLGEAEGPNPVAYILRDTGEPQTFSVEAREPMVQATVTLERLNGSGEVRDSYTIHLTGSPMLLHHHLQPTEHVWVVELVGGVDWNNSQMVSTFSEVLDDRFTAIDGPSYDWDPWVQDEFQFGYYNSEFGVIDVVVDSIRDRGLDDYAEDDIEGDDFIVGVWGNGAEPTSMDSFGNLEVSPPVTVDGVHYPVGRAYYGNGYDVGREMVEELRDHLDSMVVQKPFTVDTGWLCVGHIDEYTSTVPDPTSPKGFRFVYADTAAAWDVLDALNPSSPLPKYAPGGQDGHSMDTVSDFVNNTALRNHNEELQEDVLDPILDQFKEELGLTDEDIVLMPSLFEEPSGCGGLDAALIPGMANLIVANLEEESHVFLADPFMRDDTSSDSGQANDPMIAAVEEAMPSHLQFHFVDDWSVYHMGLGEVHCGTNMTRTPVDGWWSGAGNFFGAEEQEGE